MKILLIENSRAIAQILRRQLIKDYLVEVAYKPEEGIQKAQTNQYSVVVIDMGLSGKNTCEVCTELRRLGNQVPILVLTGAEDMQSRINLLLDGADDYLAKPYDFDELRARVIALTRRKDKIIEEDIITIKDVEINIVRREVSRAGVKIQLRRKEFDILMYLIENVGRTVNREMIMQNVWESGKESFHNTIDVHIKHLRDKIDSPLTVPLIKTVYGIGYRVDKDQ